MFHNFFNRLRIKSTLAFMGLTGIGAGIIIITRSIESAGYRPFEFYCGLWAAIMVAMLFVIAWRNI